jgi:hypothetical protein
VALPYSATPPSKSEGTQGLRLQQYAELPTRNVFRLKPLGWRLLDPEVRAGLLTKMAFKRFQGTATVGFVVSHGHPRCTNPTPTLV